jgi:hypothetical protein
MRHLTRRLASLCATALACLSLQAQAITPERFVVRSTQDLIDVCTTPSSDPLYTAAIHFCHGYLVGAYQYQEALYDGPGIKPVVCPPDDPKPTRNESVAKYIQWAKAHPEYAKERAVNTLGMFLAEAWPCKN